MVVIPRWGFFRMFVVYPEALIVDQLFSPAKVPPQSTALCIQRHCLREIRIGKTDEDLFHVCVHEYIKKNVFESQGIYLLTLFTKYFNV